MGARANSERVTRVSRGRRAVHVLLALSLALAGLEGAARWGARRAGLEGAEADPFFGFHGFQTFFEAEPDRPGWVRTRPSNVDDSRMRPLSFPAVSPRGLVRVVCIGGSVTRAEYPGFTEDVLAGRRGHPPVPLPSGRDSVEVLNSGFGGMGSTRLLFLAREIAGYGPDLVVLSSGHNEFLERNFYRPLLERDPLLLRAQTALYRSTAARVARVGVRRIRDATGGAAHETVSPLYLDMENQPFEEAPAPLGDGVDPVIRNYARNIEALVRMTLDRGPDVLIANLPTQPSVHSSLRELHWPDPFLPHVETPFTEGLGAMGDEIDVAVALSRLEAGRAGEALRILEDVAERYPRHPMVPTWQAECLDSLGRGEEAWRRRLQVVRRLSPARDRDVHNAVLRAVATRAGVPLVDAVAGIRHAGDVMGDPLQESLWQDGVHPSRDGYALLGASVAEGVEAWLEGEGDRRAPRDPSVADPDSLDAVLAALGDPCGNQRPWWVHADPTVREAAASALAHSPCGNPDSIAGVAWAHETDAAVRAAILRSMGHRGAWPDEIARALGDPEPTVRRAAVWAAGSAGHVELAVEVADFLSSPDPADRTEALWALGRLGGEDAASVLARHAPGPGPAARGGTAAPAGESVALAFALGRLGGPESVQALVEMARDRRPPVAWAALWGLIHRRRGGNRLLPGAPVRVPEGCGLPLAGRPYPAAPAVFDEAYGVAREHMAATWPPLRTAALALLGALGGDDARTALLAAPSPGSEGEVDVWLASLTRVLRGGERLGDRRGILAVRDLNALLRPAAALEEARAHDDPGATVRRARSGDAVAAAELRALIREQMDLPGGPDTGGFHFLRAAIEALGVCGDRESARDLERLFLDTRFTSDFRASAVEALGRMGDDRWIESAAGVMGRASLDLRISVLRALLRVRPEPEARRIAATWGAA